MPAAVTAAPRSIPPTPTLAVAQANKAHATTARKVDTIVTVAAVPTVAAGTGLGVGLALTAVAGIATGLGAFVLLGAVGALLYFLVFRKNETKADAALVAAQGGAPVVPGAPAVTPPKVKVLPNRPPFVDTPSPMQTAIDGFLKKAMAEYDLVDLKGNPINGPDGKPLEGSQLHVWVSPGFRMVGGMNQPIPAEAQKKITAALTPAKLLTADMKGSLHRVSMGRGDLDDIAKITQALIKAEGLTFNPDLKGAVQRWAAVRTLQWNFGIGLDCAGYVSELRSDLTSAAGKPKDTKVDDVFNKGNAFYLSNDPRFTRIATDNIPDTVQAGDVIPLEDRTGDVGHFLLMYESHQLSEKDRAYYADSRIDGRGLPVKDPKTRLYVVDSSWGAGGNPEQTQAGVSRHILFFDPTAQQWSQYVPRIGNNPPFISPTNGPYDHIVLGVYRLKN